MFLFSDSYRANFNFGGIPIASFTSIRIWRMRYVDFKRYGWSASPHFAMGMNWSGCDAHRMKEPNIQPPVLSALNPPSGSRPNNDWPTAMIDGKRQSLSCAQRILILWAIAFGRKAIATTHICGVLSCLTPVICGHVYGLIVIRPVAR